VDAGALGHAIGNLVDNAIKYAGDGREIVVGLDRKGDEIRISVLDHGLGIPAEEHDHIFDRFHRVGTSLVHDVRGSGLGLAIVKHIVEAHSGRISLTSAVSEGSEFTIHLPAGECEEGRPPKGRG
jgi:signal transduction histidine kinase